MSKIMKFLFAIFTISAISINASDSISKTFESLFQAVSINLRFDITNNAIVAHHHFQKSGVFYDTIVTKSLRDGNLVAKSYKSVLKAGVIVPALSVDEYQTIIDLLKTRIKMANVNSGQK